MVARHWNRSLMVIAAIAMALAGWATSPTAASERDKIDAALKLIPEDAAIYSSMLRNREQLEIFMKSNAWAKVKNMPIVQMGIAVYQAQINSSEGRLAELHQTLQNPEVAKIVDLFGDMFSDEVFVYGDESCTKSIELMQRLSNATRFAPMVLQLTGKGSNANPNQLQGKAAVSVLAKHTDLIQVPNFVIGFKVKNVDLAKEQLIKLEMFGNMLDANEQLKGHFKKTKIGDFDYLVLNVDGSMVPWNEVPMDKFAEWELEKGDVQKIADKLKTAKLSIALGLRDKYLLLSIGSTTDCLAKLGQGKRLIDRADFQVLDKFADKRLTSIGYISSPFNRQANDQMGQIDALVNAGEKLLPLAKLKDGQNNRIRGDVAKLVKDIQCLVPDLGAVMGFSFLTDKGVEKYEYAWGNHKQLDGSKPLTLLEHVGGNPLFGLVARGKADPKIYDGMVQWLKIGYGYFEDFGLPNIPEKERAKVAKFLVSATPLLVRLDKANREMLMPALADGQSALIVDTKLASKQFHVALPATEKAMPMLEPAVVMGVSNADLLKKGLGEYRTVINGLIDAARQIEGSSIPPQVMIPEPQTSETALGTVYAFPLPKEWGVDEKIVPNLGISKDTFVVTTSKEHTERLLKPTPLTVGGMLTKTDRPLAMAVWFDWIAFIGAATPWVDFGIDQAVANGKIEANQKDMVASQVHTGLEVLTALRLITNETYLENNVLVHHTLTEIRDVSK
jgi:hypothetical protein